MAVTCHCHSPRAHDSDPKEMTAPVPLQLCPRFPSIPVKHSALGASTPTLDPQRRWASDPRLSGPTWRRGRAQPAVRPSPMSLSRQGVANEFLDHLRSLVLTGVSLHLAVCGTEHTLQRRKGHTSLPCPCFHQPRPQLPSASFRQSTPGEGPCSAHWLGSWSLSSSLARTALMCCAHVDALHTPLWLPGGP